VTLRALALCLLPAVLLDAQPLAAPRIGLVDFFGIKKASRDRIEKALNAKKGDPLPRSKGDVEEQLELVDGVVRAQIEAVCCDEAGAAILYVGILERGGPVFEYHAPPADESSHLPEPVIDAWHQFMEQLQIAVRAGKAEEDLTRGHSLMQYGPARDVQEKFPALADTHLKVLQNVVRNSVDETERAIAAYVIAYATRKPLVVDDLQYAIQDPDDGVRNNAMRSLAAFAVLARLNPESGIKIPATWFVEQLNSLTWSDRNKAAYALVPMTEGRDAEALALLKERALDSMADMARWKHLPHALPGFILLARTAAWEEKKIQDTWAAGTHLAAVDEILKAFDAAAKKKK
jgi:hypothetical protein